MVRLFGLLTERRKVNFPDTVEVVSDRFLPPSHFAEDCWREDLLKVTQHSLELTDFISLLVSISAELKYIKDPGK